MQTINSTLPYIDLLFTVNNSLIKHTLRSNNRALAKALEQAKQELAAREQTILSMQEEQQQLRRVAGLANEQLNQEAEKRVQVRKA